MALMLLGSLAEIATIGITLPFLAVALKSDGGSRPGLSEWISHFSAHPLVFAASILIGVALLAALARLALVWTIQRFVTDLGHDIGNTLLHRILRQRYEVYLHRNSSEILSGMEKVQTVVFSFLHPAMQGLVALVIGSFVVAVLVWIDPLATGLAALSMAAIYAGISAVSRARLSANSAILAETSKERIRVVQEALGSIRDVLLDHSQACFEERFRDLDARCRRAQADTNFISAAPRYVAEAAAIVALALATLVLSARPGELTAAMPTLGALALGAQRVLPLLQQVYAGWSATASNGKILDVVLDLLETEIDTSRTLPAVPLSFTRSIRFENVSFTHRDGRFALLDIDLTVPAGARVGIVGATGSGKSTLADLLMGLLEPSAGTIFVDDVPLTGASRMAWQRMVGHVPQSIFLTDQSIGDNVAISAPPGTPVDVARMRRCAALAGLDAFVATLPEGYDTWVGERGLRLSGGQRQRIGIARALYKGASVLILDEATNALDRRAEAAVLRSLADQPELTIILIAHRESSLAPCNLIIRIDEGRLAQ